MAADSDQADCAAVDSAVHAEGAVIRWGPVGRSGLRYAVLENANAQLVTAVDAIRGASVRAIESIAVAVYPSMAEALPGLQEALGGVGAPSGMIACESVSGGVLLEWDPARTSTAVVIGLVGVELARFSASRVIELLIPLGDRLLAQIACEGLRAPELQPERILEWQLERSGVLG